MWGRLAIVLDRPAAASFAILLTSSFPFTLLWLEIHLMDSLDPEMLAACLNACSRCCPEVDLMEFIYSYGYGLVVNV
jgi:hypothetical protein